MPTPLSHSLRCRDRTLDYSRRTLIMGVLNVTPDSFSDGGFYSEPRTAIARAHAMIREGADVIDIGGESSRPGAEPVSEAEELDRVLPVIEALAPSTDVVLSIDTVKPRVAGRCLHAGVHLVNDVSGLRDPEMMAVVTEYQCAVAIMHMAGSPRTMQKNPVYEDVVGEIGAYLEARAQDAEAHGVRRDAILLDPGIGFGKTLAHNLTLLRDLGCFTRLGYPVLVGTSRKSFLGRILHDAPEDDRLAGTAASVAVAISSGANGVRVHDVAFMARVARVADRICHAEATIE